MQVHQFQFDSIRLEKKNRYGKSIEDTIVEVCE